MRIIRPPGRSYRYSYSVLHRLVKGKARHFPQMHAVMKRFFRDREVVVQQAIDLVRAGGDRTVDFRAELQRNGRGKIEIVAVPIRIGRNGSPISTHGTAHPMEEHLVKLFPAHSKEEIASLMHRIDEFLLKVYASVERCYGKFGEIGIDFGVDKDGGIWLIECNAQSAKVSIGKAYGSPTKEKIYLNPLQYAKTLARRRR